MSPQPAASAPPRLTVCAAGITPDPNIGPSATDARSVVDCAGCPAEGRQPRRPYLRARTVRAGLPWAWRALRPRCAEPSVLTVFRPGGAKRQAGHVVPRPTGRLWRRDLAAWACLGPGSAWSGVAGAPG